MKTPWASIFRTILGLSFFSFALLGHASVFAQEHLKDLYLSKDIPLDQQEQKAVGISTKHRVHARPAPGMDGSLVFTYGASNPSVYCAVHYICTILLEPGETIISINIGNSVHFKVTSGVTGSQEGLRPFVEVAPVDAGQRTNIKIHTESRLYDIRLLSHRKLYVPYIYFRYPHKERRQAMQVAQAYQSSIEAQKKAKEKAKEQRRIEGTNLQLDDINARYSIEGDAPWKPLSVFDNKKQTIIVMPQNIPELPTFHVLRTASGFFRKKQPTMVNYRFKDNQFIVDTVFDEALLVLGVYPHSTQVTIKRLDAKEDKQRPKSPSSRRSRRTRVRNPGWKR